MQQHEQEGCPGSVLPKFERLCEPTNRSRSKTRLSPLTALTARHGSLLTSVHPAFCRVWSAGSCCGPEGPDCSSEIVAVGPFDCCRDAGCAVAPAEGEASEPTRRLALLRVVFGCVQNTHARRPGLYQRRPAEPQMQIALAAAACDFYQATVNAKRFSWCNALYKTA